MTRLTKRVLFVFTAIFVLVYLTINVFFNLETVQRPLIRYVQQKIDRPVEIGYVYLNWRLYPTVSHVEINSEDHPRYRGGLQYRAEEVEIVPRWFRMIGSSGTGTPLDKVKQVQVGNLSIIHSEQSNTGSVQPESYNFSRLPELPLRIVNWDYRSGGNSIVTGRNLTYVSPDQYIESELISIAGKSLSARGYISLEDSIQGSVELKRWEFLEEPAGISTIVASGTIWFQYQEDRYAFKLDGSLAGEENLNEMPDITYRGEGTVDQPGIRLESLFVESPDLSSQWAGEFQWKNMAWTLGGEFQYQPGSATAEMLSNILPGVFTIAETSPLTGDLQVTGAGDRYSLGGEFSWDRIVLNQEVSDYRIAYELSEIQGRFERDFIRLTQASMQTDSVGLDLDGITFRVNYGKPFFYAHGKVSGQQLPKWARAYLPEVKSLPVNLAIPFSLGWERSPEGDQHSLIVRNGRFQTGTMDWEIPELTWNRKSSEEKNHLELNLLDPAENPWLLEGDPRESLRLSAKPGDITWLTSRVQQLPRAFREYTRLVSIRLQFQWDDPLEGLYDLSGSVNFKQGELVVGEKRQSIKTFYGKLSYNRDRVQLTEVRLEGYGGDLDINGSLVPRRPVGETEFDLRLRARQFELKELISSLGWPGLISGLDLSGSLRGTLDRPRIDISAGSSRITLGPYEVLNPRFRIFPDDNGLSWELTSGTLASGSVTGNGRFYYDGTMDVDLALNNGFARGLFPGVGWARENLSGNFDAQMSLNGITREIDTWDGVLTVSYQGVVMERFPPLEGIERIANLSELNERFPIRDRTHNFPIRQGQLHLEGTRIRTDHVTLRGGGTLGLDGRLNIRAELELRGRVLRAYVQDLLGELYRLVGLSSERKMIIPFDLSGTVYDPKIDQDTEAIKRQFRKNFIGSILPEQLGGPILRVIEAIFS